MITRKMLSALSMLRSDAPLTNLSERTKLNLRAARLALQRHKFGYWHRNGFRFVVTPDVPETHSIYLAQDNYEKVESAIIRKWLKEGDVAIDCGANVGLMSALMASRVGDDGCVVAVEASPETSRRLEIVIRILGLKRVKILNRCVCDHDGEVMFQHDPASSEASKMIRDSEMAASDSITVRSMRLDSLLESAHGAVPALVKLDVEGAEPQALKGARSLFASADIPLLIIEFYPRGLERLGFVPADILDQLPLNKYELWHINFSWPNTAPQFARGVPFPCPEPYLYRWPLHSNVIAIPRDGAFAHRKKQIVSLLTNQ